MIVAEKPEQYRKQGQQADGWSEWIRFLDDYEAIAKNSKNIDRPASNVWLFPIPVSLTAASMCLAALRNRAILHKAYYLENDPKKCD